MAIILSCFDSRTPIELIFELGLGDIFSVRIAGNVTSPNVLGSLEYGCAVAGAKLVLVLGHTRCSAVTTAVELAQSSEQLADAVGCTHMDGILREIQLSIDACTPRDVQGQSLEPHKQFIDTVAKRNVVHSVRRIIEQSGTLRRLMDERQVVVVGAMYDVTTGQIDFLPSDANGFAVLET